MPRGGSRPGAGRKPLEKGGGGVVLGMDGARRESAAAVAAAASTELLEPPADLLPSQQEFWRAYAANAIDQRTLVPATVAGFRELCEQFSLKAAIAGRIQKLGPASKKADVLLKQYVKLAQRVDTTMARFKLTAFGKPADGGKKPMATANPWAQVAAK